MGRPRLPHTILAILMGAVLLPMPRTAIAKECGEATPLMEGTEAPCSGVLYPGRLVREHLELRVRAVELERTLQLERTGMRRALDSCRHKLKACITSTHTRERWWKRPEATGIAGFVAGSVLTLLTAFALSHSTR